MVFSNEVELSFLADMHTKRFIENVYSNKHFNIVKSAVIYGANNVGKTCVLEAIRFIRTVLRGEAISLKGGELFNLFTKNHELALGITFLYNDKVYSFDFKYLIDPKNHTGEFSYECLKELTIDKNKSEKEKLIYIRGEGIPSKFSQSDLLTKLSKEVSHDALLIYRVNPTEKVAKELINKYKKVFKDFTDSVETVRLTSLQLNKTISYLKENGLEAKFIKEMICAFDPDIADFNYKEITDSSSLYEDVEEASIRERRSKELLSLISTHNGQEVASMLYDSRGTKEIIALSGYIVDALMHDKTLIVDELDSGLHYKNTRALVSMFNSGQNSGAQLLFTTHDTNLLDTKLLFRKDQIWFLDKKKEEGALYPRLYLYRLDEFTYSEKGIRSETDILDRYKKGYFGALPKPDLFSIMSEIADLKNG